MTTTMAALLGTDKTMTFSHGDARMAVIAAHALHHNDCNSWQWEERYGQKVKSRRTPVFGGELVTYHLGDWSAVAVANGRPKVWLPGEEREAVLPPCP